MNRIIATTILLSFFCLFANAQRQEIPFNKEWKFTGGSVSGKKIEKMVNIPHTWNATDAQKGIDYYRGRGTYEKVFIPEKEWKDQRVFVRFNGVMTIAKVYLNGELLGEHRGGYSAFIFELTEKLKFGEKNHLKVIANNEATLDVLPLVGDFNLYGGMYRPVDFIVTAPVCISPLEYASPGIYLKQSNVSESSADVEVEVKVSNATNKAKDITLVAVLSDSSGSTVKKQVFEHEAKPGESTVSELFTLKNPHLWDGRKNPYLYSVKVQLLQNNKVIDSKIQPLGLRYFRVHPDKGFILNGEPMQLHGVSRHQDRKNKGSAISYADHKQDMEIMLDMGVNALRLAHYQQSKTMYSLADSAGVVVWAELPWVGSPGGFMGNTNGYEPTESFHNNARQQLYELIHQNYNHPSIIFWSIFNEIQNPEDESPLDLINELNDIVKQEDPSRLTVGASMLDPEEGIHDITDAIAWNRYFGWYYGQPGDIGNFLDETHASHPGLCIGISEYGAGANVNQHSQKLNRPNPFGSPHPEEWQSYYHEEHLKAFEERPFVWGFFVWNMFDFGSYSRREGGNYGINDKGLVTFDRKTKKDAFYLYKANWSGEPVLHITSKRHIFRDEDETRVKVYSNLDSVSLTVNGEKVGTRSPENGIITWEGIDLIEGNNGIIVRGRSNDKKFSDDCVWVYGDSSGMGQAANIYNFLGHATLLLIIGFLVLAGLWFIVWRRKIWTVKWKRVTAQILFFVLLLAEIALLTGKILFHSFMG